MQIPLSEDDLIHICTVLRDDIILRKALLEDDPGCKESKRCLKESQAALVKITIPVLSQIYDEPSNMANQFHLN